MDNPNTISYEQDWKQAYTPVYPGKEAPQQERLEKAEKKKKKRTGIPLLTIIQLIVCATAVAAAFALKAFGGDLYHQVRNWYHKQLNDEIIMSESFDSFSLDSLVSQLDGSTDNEAED